LKDKSDRRLFARSRSSLPWKRFSYFAHILNSGRYTYKFGDGPYLDLKSDEEDENYENADYTRHFARNLVGYSSKHYKWWNRILNSGAYTYSFGDYLEKNPENEVKSADFQQMFKNFHFGASRQSLEHLKLANYLHILNSGLLTYSFGDESYPTLTGDKINENYEKIDNNIDDLMPKYDSEKFVMEKCQTQLTNEKTACETRVNTLISKNKFQIKEYLKIVKQVKVLGEKAEKIYNSLKNKN